MRKNTNQRTEHAYTYTRKYQYISSESMPQNIVNYRM